MPGRVNAQIGLITAQYGQLLRTRVRARASGRPGPRRRTGDYRRSINAEAAQIAPGVWQASVGTSAPQGRRLEQGFAGADSLGRVYHQPPYPHFGPALDETEPQYLAALGKLADSLGRPGGIA